MSKKRKRKAQLQNDGNEMSLEKRAAKKAAVLGTKKKSHLPMVAIVVCVVLVISGAVVYISNRGKNASTVIAQTSDTAQPLSVQHADIVTYPESHFMDGTAKFFQHQYGDITIKYFILKSSDGVIRAAFDACDVCWPAGQGYYQEGDHMVCRNCGRRFASIRINEIKGGCNPAPLNRSVKDGQVVIQVKDLLEGKGYFDFSQRS